MKELTLSIGGNPYTFTALTAVDVQAALEDYKNTAPDPVKQLLDTAAMLPDSIRDEFIKKHLDDAFIEKKKMGSMNDPGFQTYLSSTEGATKLSAKMLRKHHPHLTPAQAVEVFTEGVTEHGENPFLDLYPQKFAQSAD